MLMDDGTVEASLVQIAYSCVDVPVMPIRMRLSSLVFDYCLHHLHCYHVQCHHLHCIHVHCSHVHCTQWMETADRWHFTQTK